MFFTASKLLAIFIKPLAIICIFLLASLIVKNKNYKKWLLVCSTFFLFFFSNDFIANKICYAWEFQPVLIKDLPTYDVAIVLSGITESRYPPRDRIYVSGSADRILHTLHLYRIGKVKKILITGGSGLLGGSWITESEEMKRIFLLANVPDEDIILETNSKNTHENATFTKKLLEEKNLRGKFLLVTTASHIRRATACFNKAGLQTDPFPVAFKGHKSEFSIGALLIPSVGALMVWTDLFHEFVGYITYKALGYC